MSDVYEPKVGDKVRVLVERSLGGGRIDTRLPYEVHDAYDNIYTAVVYPVGVTDEDESRGIRYDDIKPWDYCESCEPAPEPQQSHIGAYESLGTQIGALVDDKQRQYGNSFGKCGDFLRILYPDGIEPDAYGDMLALVRIFDKIVRIANGGHGDNESPYRDIAGYGLLGEMEAVKRGESEEGAS